MGVVDGAPEGSCAFCAGFSASCIPDLALLTRVRCCSCWWTLDICRGITGPARAEESCRSNAQLIRRLLLSSKLLMAAWTASPAMNRGRLSDKHA